MIQYSSFTLSNGLQVVIHPLPQHQLAVCNLMYRVGSRDECTSKTGLAHFFEHFMFTGSINIPAYDEVLHHVGGNNNAYTSCDVTNYYCTLPAANLETAFWLESDRLLDLAYDAEALEVQRKVVVEEFKERCLNKPYGDVWHHLLACAYQVHPYRWPTIGQKIADIESFTMQDVKAFKKRHYQPCNAVLVVVGGVDIKHTTRLVTKWFGDLPSEPTAPIFRHPEPPAQAPRRHTVHGAVPFNAFYKAFPVPALAEAKYLPLELLTYLLGQGKASWLYQYVIEEQKLFNTVTAYLWETLDPGLLVIEGKLCEGVSFEQAEEAVEHVLRKACTPLTARALQLAKNSLMASFFSDETHLTTHAENLALSTLLGSPTFLQDRIKLLSQIGLEEVEQAAASTLLPRKSITLYYQKT